ncbi:hypothetical protein EW146_g3227 [Bondarzewia mesenterica]|uniref:Glycoside hydrolase family 125 protein n=1 Tax=Bondarzewia mesenterica TaxID=1095465 RepID=A0A4S4LYC2_9AGAM|nr:hypothetical protein EW146_g3227 [Bondarzewia mesenterica]
MLLKSWRKSIKDGPTVVLGGVPGFLRNYTQGIWGFQISRNGAWEAFDRLNEYVSNFSMKEMKKVVLGTVLGFASVIAQESGCPDYTTYAQQVIEDMKSRLRDPDIARLFENTYPNTLDGESSFHHHGRHHNIDINMKRSAQWLRDTANQLAVYRSVLPSDPELATLVRAVINNEARYIFQYPYCGAFQPPPESGLSPTHNDWADGVTVNPPVDNQTVFECKYELDSLCGFIKLSRSYYQGTGDSSILNQNWFSAIDQIFRLIWEQSQGSFDENFNYVSYYNWTGGNGALSPAVNNGGNGEPKAYTGLVGTHHRPSDDLSTFAFLTPANAMLSVELSHLANMLDELGQLQNVSQLARDYSATIQDAIWKTTVFDDIIAYETNGLGGRYVMDDANVPSLLALPYIGFVERNNSAYMTTRELLLSRRNPYYARGMNFSGIGGPHVNVWHPWPMSQISAIYGTENDDEILKSLYLIANNTVGLGLIHESQSIYEYADYTRSWFAWANSYFAEMILDLAERKPYLIFNDAQSYTPGK